MKRLYDKKVKDTLCAYVANGETPIAVAARCDVSAEVLRRWCRTRQIKWETPTSKYDQVLVAKILAEIGAGKTTIAISSRKHKISESALQRACHKHGIHSAGRGKNLENGYIHNTLDMQSDMDRAKPLQDLLTNWTRSVDLFDYIPKARKWNYIMDFLYR